jgi:hypothetical protein
MQIKDHTVDEFFECFLGEFGPAIEKRYVPASSIARYRGKLPDQLLAYWEEHGWCGYADGLFWTVNPQEYEPALEAWIGETSFMEKDAYHLIARSAFGHLLFWGERTAFTLEIFAPGSYAVPQKQIFSKDQFGLAARAFFSTQNIDHFDFEKIFASATKKLGRLKHDEMYGFVPALVLGGRATLDHLQKVKAVEHLVLLAQLAPLDVITSPPP